MTPAATLLTVETEARLRDIGEVDILIGIPSYNNARTIGHVVRAVMAGLAKYFSNRRAVLVNSDGGSSDGTPDVVARAVVDYGAMLISDRLTRASPAKAAPFGRSLKSLAVSMRKPVP
jgi:hypothetical protein